MASKVTAKRNDGNKTGSNQQAVMAEIARLSEAAKAGRLSERADLSKAEGDSRALLQGVNEMLDAVIKPLNVAAEYVDRISKGDIPAKITDTYNGDFNEIKNNLNRCIEALTGLITEMNNMSHQHDLGDIDVAIPEDKFQGAYKEMGEGVNKMVFGHIAVKKKAMACVKEFGNGNLEAQLEKFPGKKVFINETIEQLRTNLKGFISQMKHMSEQHDLGDIDVAIPADKFQGSYKDMADGVNKMVFGHIAVKKKAMACIAEFGKGNFDAPLEKFPGKKVFINDTIEQVRVNLKALIVDANILAKAAVEGKLSTRADASKHQGDFRKIVQGVNDTLNAVIGPLNVAAEYVDRISKGDIPAKITDNYNGDFNEIKNNLNRCIDAVNALVADAGVLAKAAVEGKLATRADASKHQGDFRKIVQGVDDCLDAVIGPLNVTAKYVDDISKGVIPPIITDNYNGDFNLIKNNLNAVVKMMSELLKETDVIIKAAADGELDKRANAALFLGGWNKLVSGVNDTITNIVNPLMVTADYVEKVSKGVIPPEITTVYKGQYNIIKNNLNAVVKMMSELLKETDVIIKAAADGELDKRANAALFLGGWNKLVSGVNDTITNIVNPLMVTADYVEKVSKGVIPPEITTVYKGQYNTIKNNLNAVVKMMSELLKETDVIIKAAADGELDKRANAALFLGGWNKLVSGVNDTITNIVNPLMVTADYVDKVSKGVIPPEITTVYKGQYNLIKTNLNAVVKMMGDLLKETNGLVQAAIGGQLGTRANAAQFVGGWNELVAGVNKTLDSVLQPINEAAGVLEKVAARDMTARVTGDYKGDHAKIKNALNSAVDNLDKALSQVAEATEQVSSGSQQISSGSQSLAQGANEQASSLEEVSSSLEEMSSMTKQNAENANQAKTLAGDANGKAVQGTEAMSRMSTSINKIKASSDQTAKIVKTIDEIAMQTNLLALNAAVEAARAGEAGRGFAVVAEEVRNLAQRSAEAAKNTANMIEESVNNAQDGVKISGEVSKSFEDIVSGIKKVNDLVNEIAAASQEQSQGIEQVNTAVAQMDKVTQQNAANSEESASAAEEMSSQAEELQSMIAQFALTSSGSQAKSHAVHTLTHHVQPAQKAAAARHDTPRAKVAAKPAAKKERNGHANPEAVIPMNEDALKEF
jgi:methyl-accepting chemotaxis protein